MKTSTRVLLVLGWTALAVVNAHSAITHVREGADFRAAVAIVAVLVCVVNARDTARE